jgi:hypothetical protein
MTVAAIDIIGDPAVIAKIAELARSEGLAVSEPMLTDSVSDALDAPFGVEEVRQVCEVITVMATTSTTVVGFLAAVKSLLKRSETSTGQPPTVEVKRTSGQETLARVDGDSDLSGITF